jgi:hypothetical protein
MTLHNHQVPVLEHALARSEGTARELLIACTTMYYLTIPHQLAKWVKLRRKPGGKHIHVIFQVEIDIQHQVEAEHQKSAGFVEMVRIWVSHPHWHDTISS